MALRQLEAYFKLLKPKMLAAIVALFMASMAASGGFKALLSPIAPHAVAVAACLIAGSNALNNYMDRDIDSMMLRTRRRPIPSGRIEASRALAAGLALVALALAVMIPLAVHLTPLAALGLASYLAAYTWLLKRRTGLNVVAAMPAVAAPVLAGWIVGRGFIDLPGAIMASLTMVWGLVHFWSLTAVFREDYGRAGVPTLQGVVGLEASSRLTLALSLLVAALSYLPALLGHYGLPYAVGITPLNAALTSLAVAMALRPTSGRRAWRLYKFTSPYLLTLLLIAALDRSLAHPLHAWARGAIR